MQLEGKIALVTGASRGIGKAIAVALAAAGADVAVNYAGNKAAAEAVAAEIEAMGRKVLLLQGDVAQFEVCTEMIDAVIKEFGRIDILVNNAGITRDNLLMRMKEEDWDAVLNTNLKGVFNCTKAAVKYMMKHRPEMNFIWRGARSMPLPPIWNAWWKFTAVLCFLRV